MRTDHRDIEALSASGAPVYAERGRHGGIELLAGFRTDVTGLTADESRALFILAAQGAHAALGLGRGARFRAAQGDGGAAGAAPSAAEATSCWILVDATRWKGGPQRAVDLEVLQDAVLRRPQAAAQLPARRAQRAQHLHRRPVRAVSKAGVWYLVADGVAAGHGCSGPTGGPRRRSWTIR